MDKEELLGKKGHAEVVEIFELFDLDWSQYYATKEEADFAHRVAGTGCSPDPILAVRFEDGEHLVFKTLSESSTNLSVPHASGWLLVQLTTRAEVEERVRERVRAKLSEDEAQIVGL